MKYYVHYEFDIEPKIFEDPAKAINYTENRLCDDNFEDLKILWRRDDLGWQNNFVEYSHVELIKYLKETGEITLQLTANHDGSWTLGEIANIYTEEQEEKNNQEAEAALSNLVKIQRKVKNGRNKARHSRVV